LARGPWKNPLDFGGNPDHVMSGLGTTFHVTDGRIVLWLDDGQVTTHNIEYFFQCLFNN